MRHLPQDPKSEAQGSPQGSSFQERVERAAETAMNRNGSVGPIELFQEMRLLQPVHVEGWRKGNEYYRTLQPWTWL